jgi:1,4-dihydroxy-2-naphthoate octaprenyltransferase
MTRDWLRDRTMAGCFGFMCRANLHIRPSMARRSRARSLSHARSRGTCSAGFVPLSALLWQGRAHVHVKLVSCLLLSVATLIIVVTHCKRVEEAYTRYSLPASLGPHVASSRIQHIVVFSIIAQPPTTAHTIIISLSLLPAIIILSPYSRCIAHWRGMHATASITDNLPLSALAAPLISVAFHHPPASAA